MGVGAGFAFEGEVAACWPAARPLLETSVRIRSRTIRIDEFMDVQSQRAVSGYGWLASLQRAREFGQAWAILYGRWLISNIL
jgi:hypothetical protein